MALSARTGYIVPQRKIKVFFKRVYGGVDKWRGYRSLVRSVICPKCSCAMCRFRNL